MAYKSFVWTLFEENDEKRFNCRYCSCVLSKNSTRLKEHILFACRGPIPSSARERVLEESPKTVFTRRAFTLASQDIVEGKPANSNSVSNLVVAGPDPPLQRNTLTVDATYMSQDKLPHESLLEMYTIKTAGMSATPDWDYAKSGIYDVDGRKLVNFEAGYNVITLQNGQFFRKKFVLWKGESRDMNDYLKALPEGKTVIIATMDEAKDARLLNGLDETVYDLGGSSKIFGGDMKYRSVYVLVGRRGIGEGRGKEYYRGAIDADKNAHVSVDFFISGDKFISESTVGYSILKTIKYLGTNAKQHPSSKVVYESSPTKPFEVKNIEEVRKRKVEQLKANFVF